MLMFRYAWSRLQPFMNQSRVALTPSDISRLTPKQQLQAALAYHEPPFYLFDEKWRQEQRKAIFNEVLDDQNYQELKHVSLDNLTRWQQNAQAAPGKVEVVSEDWGVATAKNTERYGQMYAVLNCADAYIVGGDFLMGRAKTQEENMWGRTTCVRYIIQALSQPNPDIFLDPDSMLFLYTPEKAAELNGEIAVTPKEHDQITSFTNRQYPMIPRCHFDVNTMQVGLLGPEVGYYNDEINRYILLRDLSYQRLSPRQYYPFIELRSAAVDLFLKSQVIDWDDPNFVAEYRKQMSQRIDAILLACVAQGKRHVVLTAIGCGAFGGKPEIVAELFKEKLTKLGAFFDHVVFAIYSNRPYNHNFEVFKAILADCSLRIHERPIRMALKR